MTEAEQQIEVKSRWSFITAPLIYLWIFQMFSHTIDSVYATMGAEQSSGLTLLSRFCLLWILGWWVLKDNQKYGMKFPYDFGLFLAAFWLVWLPYYLFKTRGIRAFITILSFIGIYILMALVANFIASPLFVEKIS